MKGNEGMNDLEAGRRAQEAVALAGWRAGRPLREIAVEIYGWEAVEACWDDNSSGMRSIMRRLLSRARAKAAAGTDPDAGPA